MTTLTAALSLLTRLPLRRAFDEPGSAAFGIVGVLMGLLAAVTVIAIGDSLPLLAAVGPPAVLTILSGALHLDGMADTADAIAAPNPEAAERARKDPSSGPAGVGAVVLTVLVQVAAIASICGGAGALVAATAVVAGAGASRAAAALGAAAVTAKIGQPGLGGWFIGRTSTADAIVAAGTVLAVAAALSIGIWSPVPIVAAVTALGGGAATALALRRLRGGLDGDGLGAVIEISFALGLVGAALASVLG